ncbi:uncharacterized protein LTR77_008263 [Saxophila tyrrhenica]|uniref:Uncharacterized protein n=1 Tax=Saxophila tyrrhenica TaxID=1690608 RepID=A0AAV9P6B8_9PEZI|nr:hypothetical protein LTR77_008263 [Saxophila tyrrhenica]
MGNQPSRESRNKRSKKSKGSKSKTSKTKASKSKASRSKASESKVAEERPLLRENLHTHTSQVAQAAARAAFRGENRPSRHVTATKPITDWLSDFPDTPAPPMPSPNAAQISPTKKGADLGRDLARKRSQDFKSKIEGWNEGGAGVAQEQNEVVVVVEEEEEAVNHGADQSGSEAATADPVPTTPKTPKSDGKAANNQASNRKTSREIDTQKKAWVRRRSKPAVEISPDVKAATTPKKRLVSDGHWRRDRVVKKEEPSPEKDEKDTSKDITPKPVTVRRSVVSVGLKVPPSTQDFVEQREPRKVPRRSRSPGYADNSESAPDYESPGTKVYVKPRRRRSRTLDEQGKVRVPASDSSFTAPSSAGKPSTSTDITTPDPSPTKDYTPRPRTAPKERTASKIVDDVQTRNRSSDAEDAPRRVSRGKQRLAPRAEDDKPAKSRIPANKPPHTPIPKFPGGGGRIQGWLAEMPEDPFSAPSEPSVVSDEPRHTNKRTSDGDELLESSRRRSGGRARRSKPSPEPVVTHEAPQGWNSIDDWVNDSTPTNLKRRGARRNTQSPVKDRAVRGVSAAPSDRQSTIMEGSVLSRASDGDEPALNGPGLKRRLTKHSDLMSVLSTTRDNNRIAPARSMRTRRVSRNNASVPDLMNEISTDELKYQRELRTLVDGVIPVLLTYVISKSDASKASGSRKSSLHDNPALTQPIYDMGVSLERLKTSHKRIPMHDANELLLWAQTTAKVYSEYLRVWRLGFEDIVVNLAPANESSNDGSSKWDNGIQQPGKDTASSDEQVDVAYLLKRPLVRIKNLSKTLKAICQIKPSALADDVAAAYQDLVADARQRSNDERARLEDEAAAAVDPTRARDPRNLVQLNGVRIDPARSVRARDYFDMELYHSSGQQVGCKVELIRRDNPPRLSGAGDVLFCEVDVSGRWLLFPPILANYVTARRGDKDGELVVMVRGLTATEAEWREVMSLQSSEDQSEEWLDMLGSDPMPPRLTRQSSFNALRIPSRSYDEPPSPTESEVPIGEQAGASAPRWDGSEVNSSFDEPSFAQSPSARPKRYHGAASSPRAHIDTIAEERPSSAHDRLPENQKRSRYHHVRSKTEGTSGHESNRPGMDYSTWSPSPEHASDYSADEDDRPAGRPTMHRRTSSVPSQDMPTINKLRKTTAPKEGLRGTATPKTHVEDPSSAPAKLQKKSPNKDDSRLPPTPTQSSRPSSMGLRSGLLPSLTPAFMKKHRRSSSPLKHEYEPSTASDSYSDSEYSDEDDGESITSESTVDEAISTLGELKDFTRPLNVKPARAPSPKSSPSFDQPEDTLRPSDSPSQAPYRTVPPSTNGSAKSLACILSWNDRGSWDSMHPEECEIVVTPGLIEAFDLAQAHAVAGKINDLSGASPSTHGVKPLIALELTPLVPLRRGTALDISIRSPPTANSVLRMSGNIMLRSRSPEECERLYNLINRARIDNPTWIALQNARGPMPTSNWAETMDRRNAARGNGSPSWIKSLSRKGSSYRSKGARSASIAGSQSSVGTMNSAMSALRKFSNGSRIFNIAKSTIVSREGTGSSGSDSLDSGAATPTFDLNMGTPLGVTNTKCRLYARHDASKWRDMGSARLTIMLPPRPDPSIPVDPSTTGMTKRVLVTGKSRGEQLLDVTLEERCFERIGRTGIAITIWQELVGPDGTLGRAAATGGVGSSQTRTFMLQMKSERDAAFTFSMVGKLRY